MHKLNLTKLGNNIRASRKNRKLSMDALSERCGISSRHLANIERGIINPSYDVLYAIVHELAIPSDLLFYPDMRDSDKRTKLLLTQFESCSAENQDIVLSLVESLIHQLSRRY